MKQNQAVIGNYYSQISEQYHKYVSICGHLPLACEFPQDLNRTVDDLAKRHILLS